MNEWQRPQIQLLGALTDAQFRRWSMCVAGLYVWSSDDVTPVRDARSVGDGRQRADVPYLWPSTLIVPERPPRLIYLDMNHWIGLAKANTGHPDGARHSDALSACIQAADARTACFPISDSTFFEVSQIGRFRQRRDVRDVIERVSRYFVVTARNVVATHEIEAALDALVGPSRDPINTMDYLDWGVARAFGMAGGFKVFDEAGSDVTEESRLNFPGGPVAFDTLLNSADLELVRNVLAGPSPADEPAMREMGWRPSDVGISRRRADQEIEQVARFNTDPSWRRGRIRDVIAAREILIELNEILRRGLTDRGAELADVFPNPEVTRSVFDAMPSFDVAVSIKTSYHTNPHHRWTPNDIHDIDALGSTIPYCDIVVTDKAVASHLHRTGIAERLSTIVLTTLDDLAALL